MIKHVLGRARRRSASAARARCRPDDVRAVLEAGNARARAIAAQTMQAVRDGRRAWDEHDVARLHRSSSTSSKDRSISCCTSSRRTRSTITDIPVARITDQYLALPRGAAGAQPRRRRRVPGDGGDADATSSRACCCRPDPDDEDEAEADPRADLVQQLLEYQRYREAAADLRASAVSWSATSSRPRASPSRRTIPRRPRPRVRDASLGRPAGGPAQRAGAAASRRRRTPSSRRACRWRTAWQRILGRFTLGAGRRVRRGVLAGGGRAARSS